MNAYTEALAAFAEGRTQMEVAAALDCPQATISRYLNGRLPTREMAEKIDLRSGGKVPFATWQQVQAARLGIAA